MSHFAVFFHECPTCGRNLRIPVKYFGRPMTCTHCGGIFEARANEPALRGIVRLDGMTHVDAVSPPSPVESTYFPAH
jgi:hypothetical protein